MGLFSAQVRLNGNANEMLIAERPTLARPKMAKTRNFGICGVELVVEKYVTGFLGVTCPHRPGIQCLRRGNGSKLGVPSAATRLSMCLSNASQKSWDVRSVGIVQNGEIR